MIIQETYFKITNRSIGSVLDCEDELVCTNELGSRNSQRWLFEKVEDGYYRIIQDFTKQVLEGNARGDVFTRQWNGGDNQKWSIDNVGDGYCCLVHKATGRVLDACFSGRVHNIYWNGAQCQQWKLESIAELIMANPCEIQRPEVNASR
ncbi:RICIN domain-containing protein [uncultured Acetobacteroides sp.]|uniref:RICIN domain-containing protein n=1 Tax=uncultured Acetobacteroides sp. TaxID=1760811 RepID=UPI0029F523BF|nr:RICIN domain-containing protein [uncultured Acetobacteroides sp.]